jgi:hypothetical protein
MSSTYSPILRTELIGAGDQAGTWGSTTNSNFQYIFESAIAGYVAVTVSPTSNNQVLTYVNGPSASAALDQSIYAILKLIPGTLGANFNIFAPPVSKTYVVWNNTSYTASFYNSTVIGNTTPAGSAIVIPAGAKVLIWSDGTSFYGNDTAAGNFTVAGNLTVSGTTSLTSGAISGVITAPTASPGTNTTQLATTAFVLANNFPSGTRLTFAQAAAPTFWTQDTSDTANNRMLRVVNSTGGGVGGSADPTVMNVVPSHTHTFTSGTMNSNTSHSHGVYDPGHAHGLENVIDHYGYGSSFGVRGDYPVPPADVTNSTNGATTNISIYATNIDHTHSGTTNNNSGSNWTPRYVNLIICSKD